MKNICLLMIHCCISMLCLAQDRMSLNKDVLKSTQNIEGIKFDCAEKEDTIYTIVEQMPSFPGGEVEMMQYISNNWILPKEESELIYRRSISVRFYIGVDGNVNDVKIERSTHNNAADSCFTAMIKDMPKWEAGRQNGKKVPVYYFFRMFFSLKGDR